MERLDDELVRSLADFHSGAPAVSCYVDLDPSVVPNERVLSTHVTSLVDRAEASGAAANDAAHIERFLTSELDRGGISGVALFCSEAEDVSHEVGLSDTVDDAVHVGRSFALAPLLPLLDAGDVRALPEPLGLDVAALLRYP